jgi:signal transduction histidine kinase
MHICDSDAGGIGIGLYLSTKIMVLHSGDIWAASTANAGTTISVLIPILQG